MTESCGIGAVRPPSGTVTFFFSDIEGSTRRWSRDREAMQAALRLHDQHMRAAITTHGGYIFKTMGDAFCAAFATPKCATSAALDAQRALGATDFSTVDGLRVRMAINTGTADERDGDYFGPALNRVARLLTLGHGGQVLLSSTAAELVRANPPPGITLADLGEHELKDIEGIERIYQLVAPDLRRHFPELRSLKALQPWLIPEAMRTRYFTGRDDLLARLREQLQERHRGALSGLGGAGKTQAAIEYAIRHRAEYPNGVFWVNAETIGGLTSGLVEIAKALQLSTAESNDQEAVVAAVLEWLNRHDGWLLILDNVEERGDLRGFVPTHGKGDVLITSRESVFAELGIPRALEVRDLNADEAVRFLLARTGRDDADSNDRGAASELAAELGNLPLALEQAAAYITETNVSFSAYLSAFRKRRITLLEKAGAFVSHETVAVTWAANFEAVQRVSPAAADVLRVSALLAPDAIPFEFFLDGARSLGDSIAEALADPDDLAIAEALRPLARYSLIRTDAGTRAFSVHRVVQEIARAAVPEPERRAYVKRAVLALYAAFPEVEYANWSLCGRLVPHVASIARWLGDCDGQPESVGGLLSRAALYLSERGRYAEAQALHERALTVRESAFAPDHPDVAISLNNLAVVHWYRGRYAEAQALNERALAIRERALPPDHPDLANSLTLQAILYSAQGRYAEAEPLYERALAIRERALGPDHPSLARSLSNLANSYEERGAYAESLPLYERALAIWQRALGPEHPDVAAGLDNLGRAYAKHGRYADAESLFERALAMRERSLGPDHPDIRYSLSNLADLSVNQGKYTRAEALYQRALSIQERTLLPDHRSVAITLTGFANLRAHQGRLAESEALYERALSIHERSIGSDHVFAADTLVGLASLRKEQGRTPDAITLYERALAIRARTFASDHPALAELRSTIGALRDAMTADVASQVDAAAKT